MDKKFLTNEVGTPVPDNTNSLTAGERGPILLEDNWLLEKLAHFDREVIPERRMHAKGSGAFGCFTVTNEITRYSCASVFSKVGKKTDVFVRFSTTLIVLLSKSISSILICTKAETLIPVARDKPIIALSLVNILLV